MDTAEYGELDVEIIQWITQRVTKFRGWYGINAEDIEDFSQDILVGLNRELARLRKQRPVKNPKALALSFAKKRMTDVLRKRLSYKGTLQRRTRVLVNSFFDQERLPGDTSDRVRMPKQLRDMTQAELAVQVEEITKGLPDDLKDLCALLRHRSKSYAARSLGVSRSRLDRMVEKLRAAFIAGGFTEFATRIRATANDTDDECDAGVGSEETIKPEPAHQQELRPQPGRAPQSEGQESGRRSAKIIHLNRPYVPPVQEAYVGD